jgi:hypothetical protein
MDMPEGANVAVPGDYSLVKSSLSNKGNPTSQGFDNLMLVEAKQPVRIIDTKGNVLFEGIGPEAARQAVAMGQNLSDTLGNKAGWDIQTVPVGTSNFKTIANEKVNKSTLQQIGKVVGTALPLAVSLIPGLQVLGPVLSSVVAGGAGAAMAGRDPLKGALTAGLTAGGGEFLGPILNGAGIGLDAARAIGTGIGATTGGLATGQNLTNSLLSGAAAGGLSYLGGQIFKPGQSGLDEWAKSQGIYDLASLETPTIGSSVVGTTLPMTSSTGSSSSGTAPSDFTATGTRLSGPTFYGGNNLLTSARYAGDGPTPSDYTATARETAQDQATTSPFAVNTGSYTPPAENIDVEAKRAAEEKARLAALAVRTDNTIASEDIDLEAKRAAEEKARLDALAVRTDNTIASEDIDLEAKKDTTTDEDNPLSANMTDVGNLLNSDDFQQEVAEEENDTKGDGLTTEQKIRLAALALSTLGGLGGGGGTSGGGGTIPGGLGRLTSPLFTQQLSVLTPEQNRAKYGARNMTGTDWATWGSRPATSFFQNVQQQPTGMAHGGSFAAKRGGSKPRTQFAVNGPGTGRSDDIPAVLSDGEYVIDAETVALLGDGSSKAGAKKLDDLRVKVRKHKGKKLAKGRFSANAKSPEAYLSGGRA